MAIVYQIGGWWWWTIFMECLTGKRYLAWFSAGTVVRDSHYLKYSIRRKQDMNLRRTWIQALLSEVVQ